MKKILFCCFISLVSSVANGQSVAINTTGSAPNASAILDVSSTSKGILIPRMNTTQRDLIASPLNGLMIYNTSTNSFNYRNLTTWVDMASSTQWQSSGSDIYRASGNVGIGTSTPIEVLDVNGALKLQRGTKTGFVMNMTDPRIYSTNDNGAAYPFNSTNLGNLVIQPQTSSPRDILFITGYGDQMSMVVKRDGKVGIGTTFPEELLHVNGVIQIQRESGPQNFLMEQNDPKIWSPDDFPGATTYPFNAQAGNLIIQPRTSAGGRDIVFVTGDGSNVRMIVNRYGNVGINTTNPQEQLHIAGGTQTNYLKITGGSDITEGTNSLDDVQPGEVIVIDPTQANHVKRATRSYDKTVLGVVSGAGGIHSGMKLSQEEALEGGISFAIAGRVYVKVTGGVQPGDLLTTSDEPGKAMVAKSRKKRDGAVIGKALSVPNEEGLVLMLVMTR